MDFTHRFTSRPMPIQVVIDDYYKPAKVKKMDVNSRNFGRSLTTPALKFNPEDILKKFKYLYVIGREYEVPKLDRQKIVKVRDVNHYRERVTKEIDRESWDDMMIFERDHPGTLALMPGKEIFVERVPADKDDETDKGQKRFSIEGIGIDAETLAKFELGLLTRWPQDGHLPVKINKVMGFLSDEYIPVDEFKMYFPDAHKNYVNFTTSSSEQIEQRAKRQDSWLDNQARQRRELDDIAKSPDSWAGYKSSEMESGSIMQEKPWLNIEVEGERSENTSGLPSEHLGLGTPDAGLPNEHLGMRQEERSLPTEHLGEEVYEAGLPNEHFHRQRITEFFEDEEYPPPKRDQSFSDNFTQDESAFKEDPILEEEDDDNKYKWLGFKRSLDEVEENFYNRPIPKFNVSEETEEQPVVEATPQIEPETPSQVEAKVETQVETQNPELSEETESGIDYDEVKSLLVQKVLEKKQQESKRENPDQSFELPSVDTIDNVLGAALSIAKELASKE